MAPTKKRSSAYKKTFFVAPHHFACNIIPSEQHHLHLFLTESQSQKSHMHSTLYVRMNSMAFSRGQGRAYRQFSYYQLDGHDRSSSRSSLYSPPPGFLDGWMDVHVIIWTLRKNGMKQEKRDDKRTIAIGVVT